MQAIVSVQSVRSVGDLSKMAQNDSKNKFYVEIFAYFKKKQYFCSGFEILPVFGN
jgi:hypothetical protein